MAVLTLGETLAKMVFALPAARRVLRDLPQPELHELAAGDGTARPTNYGARERPDDGAVPLEAQHLHRRRRPRAYPHQAIDRDEWERISALQDAYIADQEMIQVDGYIGNDPEHRVPARLFIEARNANIAGMQDVLYFHNPDAERSSRSWWSSTRPTWPCPATRTTA